MCFCVNFFSQSLHICGLKPEWILRCNCRSNFLVNDLVQCKHFHFFSIRVWLDPFSNLESSSLLLLKCFFSCLSRSLAVRPDHSQRLHINGLILEWTILCLCKASFVENLEWHLSHLYGFRPLWVRKWIFNRAAGTFFPQYLQAKIFLFGTIVDLSFLISALPSISASITSHFSLSLSCITSTSFISVSSLSELSCFRNTSPSIALVARILSSSCKAIALRISWLALHVSTNFSIYSIAFRHAPQTFLGKKSSSFV